ncbi:MAG: hypothetical protein ABSG53_34090 [Thermoguttaceae bacterium]
MKVWQIFVLSLLGLALAGCHSDPEVAYLQRDNLRKEREIERLRNQIEDMQETGSCGVPAQPGMLRDVRPGELPPEPGTTENRRSGQASTRPAPPFTPSGRNSEPELSVPGRLNISPGMEVKPGEVPERMRVPGESRPPQETLPHGSPAGGSSLWSLPDGQPSARVLALPDNSSVAQITLHPALTGGIGTSSRPSDEGLLVVVEPRDFGGNIVNAPGNISVALLDPALTGEQARLARWDFAAAETQGMIRTGSQPGIHLRLPWVSTPPHDRLKVFVRYTTRDGRKLQAERLVGVALNGPLRRQ